MQQRRRDQFVYGRRNRARSGGVQRSAGFVALVDRRRHGHDGFSPGLGSDFADAPDMSCAAACRSRRAVRKLRSFAAQRVDGGLRITQIAEADGARRAGGLAGGHDFAFANPAIPLLGVAPRAADALNAISAFLHHAAAAHRDIRIENCLHALVAEVFVFLAVGIAEEIEAADLVRTVRLAKAGADAAIVDLDVKSLAVVDRGRDRADGLARRMLALHAWHRRKAGLAVDQIIVDPQPMHIAPGRDLVGADDRHIVFRLAGDDACVAADARAVVDHHRPRIGVVVVGRIKCRRIGSRLRQSGHRPRQLGQRQPRLQILGFAFELEEMLGQQDVLVAAGAARPDIVDGPRRLRSRAERLTSNPTPSPIAPARVRP